MVCLRVEGGWCVSYSRGGWCAFNRVECGSCVVEQREDGVS